MEFNYVTTLLDNGSLMYLLDLEVTKNLPESSIVSKSIPYMNIPTTYFYFFTVENDCIKINYIENNKLCVFVRYFKGFETLYELKSLLYNTNLIKQELVEAEVKYNRLMEKVGVGTLEF